MPLTAVEHLLADVDAAPAGSGIAALFDLDRTLIAGFSAQDMLLEQLRSGGVSVAQLLDGVAAAVRYGAGRIEFVEFVNRAAAALAGRPDAENHALGQRVFDARVAQRIYPEARALIDAHRRRGHRLAVISSATPYQVEPVARALGIPHALCTRLEVVDGVCTGRVLEPACFGPGKAVAARELAARLPFDLTQSYFYSDGSEDLPLLEIVGRPRVLNPDLRLTQVARERNWPSARFVSRGVPSPLALLRSGLAYSVALPALAFGAADLALNGSLRDARNLTSALWGELAAAAIDLKLEVTGEDNLWKRRPAVFVFNHQSALDAVVMAKLLRRDFTGIAKAEIRRQPLLGTIAELAGAIFIERSDRASALESLSAAVAALRDGTSIAIAPEGTRSPTAALGPFKKGAFHLALQAGVPMVAVVIKNTTDWMPKGAWIARPGTVEITVSEPIDTSQWQAGELDRHVEAVRQLFVDVLAS
jgi:putative phosphoserine phosphatase / 1-acylglycerol-3-phosphate O-acyltransferase